MSYSAHVHRGYSAFTFVQGLFMHDKSCNFFSLYACTVCDISYIYLFK